MQAPCHVDAAAVRRDFNGLARQLRDFVRKAGLDRCAGPIFWTAGGNFGKPRAPGLVDSFERHQGGRPRSTRCTAGALPEAISRGVTATERPPPRSAPTARA